MGLKRIAKIMNKLNTINEQLKRIENTYDYEHDVIDPEYEVEPEAREDADDIAVNATKGGGGSGVAVFGDRIKRRRGMSQSEAEIKMKMQQLRTVENNLAQHAKFCVDIKRSIEQTRRAYHYHCCPPGEASHKCEDPICEDTRITAEWVSSLWRILQSSINDIHMEQTKLAEELHERKDK